MSITRVAKRAGVSPATVSLVINNKPSISAATAEAVRQAMAEIGYIPVTEGQRRGRPPKRETFTRLAFISNYPHPWMNSTTYMDVLHEVEETARNSNATVLIHSIRGNGEKDFEPLRENVDGLLLLGNYPSSQSLGSMKDLPCVQVMGAPRMPNWCDQVTYRGESIGHLAGTYLLQNGHLHTGYIFLLGGPLWTLRQRSFEATVEAAGGTVKSVVASAAFQGDSRNQPINQDILRELLNEVLESSPRPTSLFLSSDVLAAPVYWLLLERGLAPMKDIEIVSCNNDRTFLNSLYPQPAVIDIHTASIARQAVERLLWRMQHRDAPSTLILLEPSLLVNSPEAPNSKTS